MHACVYVCICECTYEQCMYACLYVFSITMLLVLGWTLTWMHDTLTSSHDAIQPDTSMYVCMYVFIYEFYCYVYVCK